MARKPSKTTNKRHVASYTHPSSKRLNNPPVGLVTPETDRDAGRKTYAFDPHLDPALQWAGKAERHSFDIPTVSLHVHERIDPRSIIEAVRKKNGENFVQGSLFSQLEENPPLRDAVDFYKHKHNWSNRLIAGDSLLVMNSLLEKEGMAGKIQMAYFDPPYGIRYGSNFQPFVNKRKLSENDADDDLTTEPEMLKAFRDTWELGIHSYRPRLTLDWSKVGPLELNASQTAKLAELAPVLEGKPDVSKVAQIDLERLARDFRTQKIIFETARDVYEQMQKDWQGGKEALLAQLVRLVEQFIRSDKIAVIPALFSQDDLKRRLVITLNMTRVVQHIWEAIRFENTEKLEPVFDRDRPIRSTGDMGTWYTGKPCERTAHSHINFCVYDSTWEANESFELDHNPAVEAWVKNDHLGFEILYIYRGVVRKYRPDFLIRYKGGHYLVLETKGKDTEQDQTKRRFLAEWIDAVNAHGGFGHWSSDVSFNPGDIKDVLQRHQGRAAA